MKCIGPKRRMLTDGFLILEEVRRIHPKKSSATRRRARQGKKLPRDGLMLGGGEMAQIRASTVQQSVRPQGNTAA